MALYTSEAEYMALSAAANEAVWLNKLLTEMYVEEVLNDTPVLINADNTGSICIAEDVLVNSRTKHIDIRIHNIWKRIESKEIEVKYVSTSNMKADMTTKPLLGQMFVKFRDQLGLKKIGQ